MIRSSRLDGGASLLVDTTAATGVAAVGVWYDFGSRDEPALAGDLGTVHFVEHMLFKGTRSRSAYDISRRVDAMGGSINAFTERECLCLHVVAPEDAFEDACSLLADMAGESVFDRAEFERERAVVANEIESAEDDPEETAADALIEAVWPGHPLARKIAGDAATNAALDRDRVFRVYDKLVRPGPALVSVAGDVGAERAVSALNAAFGNRGGGGRPEGPELPLGDALRRDRGRAAPAEASAPRRTWAGVPFKQAQSFLAFPSAGRAAEGAYYELAVANAALGDSMGSRLFQRLREELGLCYAVGSSLSFFDDASLLVAYSSSSAKEAAAATEALGEVLAAVAARGFADEEIADARSHLRGCMKIAASDADYRMRRMARRFLAGLDPLEAADAIARVEAVRAGGAAEALRAYLSKPAVAFGTGPASAGKAWNAGADAALAAIEKSVRRKA